MLKKLMLAVFGVPSRSCPWSKRKKLTNAPKRKASVLFNQGFHLGGVIHSNRDEWHER